MKINAFILLVVISIIIMGCGHEHTYKEASCTEPKTCTICGLTEGDPTDHVFNEATCLSPSTCSICGATRGTTLEHEWSEATCLAASTCSMCGKTNGEPLAHVVENGITLKDPNCTEEGELQGICSICNQEVTVTVEPLGHTHGVYEIVFPATYYSTGKKSKSCLVCGVEISTVSYELSEEEKEQEFKADCPSWTYEQIARNPDSVYGDNAMFTGEVIQIIENGLECEMRINITKTGDGYKDTIYVTYTRKNDEDRILEDDVVTLWGWLEGTKTYTTVLGSSVTIPYVKAQYLKIK